MSNPTKSVAPRDRASVLSHTRNLKMAQSQHAYVRGSTVKFYEWLAESGGKIPEGPPVWICGDCHLGNIGPLADTDGKIALQIRDLDQTVIGNPAHDIIRLALSLASVARGFDLPGAITARMVEAIIGAYVAGLDGLDPTTGDKPAAVGNLLRLSQRRRWRHLAHERLHHGTPSIPLGRKYWALQSDERKALTALLSDAAVAEPLATIMGDPGETPVTLVDAAYWMKGCSSLGALRYAAIVRCADDSRPAFLDLKEATRAAAPRDAAATMPRDNALRIVTGARALSPNLGDRMIAGRLGEAAIVIRELMPQDLKLELATMTAADATAVAATLAAVVGRAHGRQMDAHLRAKWSAELTSQRSKAFDAPSWLWSSVVELVALHEAAYLEHCRRYLDAA